MNNYEIAKKILKWKKSEVGEVAIVASDGKTLVELPLSLLKKWARVYIGNVEGGSKSKRPPEKFDEKSIANRERVRRFRERQKESASSDRE